VTIGSAAAAETARAIWARAADAGGTPEEAVDAAERICAQLRDGLSRWVGAGGFRALLGRALRMVQPEHPALGSLSCLGEIEATRPGGARSHDAAEVGAGMTALVTTLIELLGRIIGDEMAVSLVERVGLPGPRLVVTSEKKRARNG
jgi:hypothetical protein